MNNLYYGRNEWSMSESPRLLDSNVSFKYYYVWCKTCFIKHTIVLFYEKNPAKSNVYETFSTAVMLDREGIIAVLIVGNRP